MDTNAKNVAQAGQPAPQEKAADNSLFLTRSGWVLNVAGIIAFVAGLVIGATGVWITGCAGILAGCYCLVKGRQARQGDA